VIAAAAAGRLATLFGSVKSLMYNTDRGDRVQIITVHARPRGQRGRSMKKADADSDELRAEYKREDFGVLVRGKYAARAKEASNVVVLDPDVAEAFPNALAVNQALRGLLELAKANVRTSAQSLHQIHEAT
jgi:hypothetical protein